MGGWQIVEVQDGQIVIDHLSELHSRERVRQMWVQRVGRVWSAPTQRSTAAWRCRLALCCGVLLAWQGKPTAGGGKTAEYRSTCYPSRKRRPGFLPHGADHSPGKVGCVDFLP